MVAECTDWFLWHHLAHDFKGMLRKLVVTWGCERGSICCIVEYDPKRSLRPHFTLRVDKCMVRNLNPNIKLMSLGLTIVHVERVLKSFGSKLRISSKWGVQCKKKKKSKCHETSKKVHLSIITKVLFIKEIMALARYIWNIKFISPLSPLIS